MYFTAYNLWTFTWFVHFELPFRLKGTEKIHTERFFKFPSNIYSILYAFTENRKGKLSIFWFRLGCTECYFSKEETLKITSTVPLKGPKKRGRSPKELRCELQDREREYILATALGPLAAPLGPESVLTYPNHKINTNLSLSCN